MDVVACLAFFTTLYFAAVNCDDIQYKTFRSSAFELLPGGVHLKIHRLDWIPGHVGIRSFNAEIVDDLGNSVPLSELYLHHWIIERAFVNDTVKDEEFTDVEFFTNRDKIKIWPNSGTCENRALHQWFGLGSETRHTDVTFPAPYAIEAGNAKIAPKGYSEAWYVQIHAIDIRETLNPSECLECRCNAYNASRTERGHPIPKGYKGGLLCCHEGVRCALKPSYKDILRTYHLQYTIGFVPFTSCIKPLRVYILDITDNRKPMAESRENSCQVEYTVEACSHDSTFQCIHTMNQTMEFPVSGHLVYTVGHLHAGGLGITLSREDNGVICESLPRYGRGSMAGDEAGYVTGMGVCLHKPEERVTAGEKLTLSSWYSSRDLHTGVMGLMFLAVAVEEDYSPPLLSICGLETAIGLQHVRLGSAVVFPVLAFVIGCVLTLLIQRQRVRNDVHEYNLVA